MYNSLQDSKAELLRQLSSFTLVIAITACTTTHSSLKTELMENDLYTSQLKVLADRHADIEIEITTQVVKKDDQGNPEIVKYVINSGDEEFATVTHSAGQETTYVYHKAQPGVWAAAWQRAKRQPPERQTRFEVFVIDLVNTMNSIEESKKNKLAH